jgi:hypothetical protein
MTQRSIMVVLPLVVLLAILWGCENDTSNDVAGPGDGGPTTDKTCLGCHSSEDALKEALGGKEVTIAVNKEEDG